MSSPNIYTFINKWRLLENVNTHFPSILKTERQINCWHPVSITSWTMWRWWCGILHNYQAQLVDQPNKCTVRVFYSTKHLANLSLNYLMLLQKSDLMTLCIMHSTGNLYLYTHYYTIHNLISRTCRSTEKQVRSSSGRMLKTAMVRRQVKGWLEELRPWLGLLAAGGGLAVCIVFTCTE